MNNKIVEAVKQGLVTYYGSGFYHDNAAKAIALLTLKAIEEPSEELTVIRMRDGYRPFLKALTKSIEGGTN